MKIVINTNEPVYFKPTEVAKKHFKDYMAKGNIHTIEMGLDKEGYTSMEFWAFMSIFGSLYKAGTRNVPSVENDLEFRGAS